MSARGACAARRCGARPRAARGCAARAVIPSARAHRGRRRRPQPRGRPHRRCWLDVTLRIGDGEPVARASSPRTRPASRGSSCAARAASSSATCCRAASTARAATAAARAIRVRSCRRSSCCRRSPARAPGGAGELRRRRAGRLGLGDEHDCYVLGGRAPRTGRCRRASRRSGWTSRASRWCASTAATACASASARSGAFGRVRLPRWIAIEPPGQPRRGSTS